jgi:hypothetical protein
VAPRINLNLAQTLHCLPPEFLKAFRQTASHGERMRTTIFGAVPVEDYVRFMELHTRHHGKQMEDR